MRYNINFANSQIDTESECFVYEIKNKDTFLDNMIYYAMYNDNIDDTSETTTDTSDTTDTSETTTPTIKYYDTNYIEIITEDNTEKRAELKVLMDELFEDFHARFDESKLDRMKKTKKLELSQYSKQFDGNLINDNMYVDSSVGFRVNADLRSQNNLQRLISSYTNPVYYKDYYNELHLLDKDQLTTILNECALNGQNLYQQKWEMQSNLEKLSYSKLKRLTFNFTMMDFSGKSSS